MDLDPKFEPTVCCDIMELDEASLGHFDMIWASPVCTEYSQALRKRPRNLEAGDRLVLRALEVIRNLRPQWWALENPQTGLLKTRPFMQGLPFSDVCYCKCGTGTGRPRGSGTTCLGGPQRPCVSKAAAAPPSQTASTPRQHSGGRPRAAAASRASSSSTACLRGFAKSWPRLSAADREV